LAGKRRSKYKLPPFVPLTWTMLNHKAYKDLKPSASKALPYFLGKVKGIPYNDPQRYKVEFIFPYIEAQNLGFSSSTWAKVIEELVSKGFVDPVDKGGLRGYGKSCSVFKLSQRWETYGNKNFVRIDWKTFLPGVLRSNVTPKCEMYNSIL